MSFPQTQPHHSQQPQMSAMLITPDLTGDSNWYPDSGATNHNIHDFGNLSISNEMTGGQQVHTANGAGLPIYHSGYSSLISSSNYVFHLQNLLHVPFVTKKSSKC